MPDQPKDTVTRAPESGEQADRPHGTPAPADDSPADPTPPGQPTVGQDWESGRQSAG